MINPEPQANAVWMLGKLANAISQWYAPDPNLDENKGIGRTRAGCFAETADCAAPIRKLAHQK